MIEKAHVRADDGGDGGHCFRGHGGHHFGGDDVGVHDAGEDGVNGYVFFLWDISRQIRAEEEDGVLTIRKILPVALTKFNTAAFAPSYSGYVSCG